LYAFPVAKKYHFDTSDEVEDVVSVVLYLNALTFWICIYSSIALILEFLGRLREESFYFVSRILKFIMRWVFYNLNTIL